MLLFVFINFFPSNCPKYWCFPCLHHFLLTHLTIWTTNLIFPCCFLFKHVAILPLSVPRYFDHQLFTPSLCFDQKTLAYFLLIDFIDPHACFVMFLHFICLPQASESCPYVLAHFSNLEQDISSIGFCAVRLYIFGVSMFCRSRF